MRHPVGDLAEAHAHGGVARVDRIHQNLREIEKGVMGVQLRAEGAGGIDVDLILDDRTTFSALNLPATFVELAHCEFLARAIFGADPVHILGKVANLIEGVPHRKLEIALRGTGGQDDLNLRPDAAAGEASATVYATGGDDCANDEHSCCDDSGNNTRTARSGTSREGRNSLGLRQLAQARWQFFINPTEAAVGKNCDYVSAAHFGGDGLDDGVGIGQKACPAAVLLDLCGEGGQLQAFVFGDGFGAEDSGDNHFVGLRQAARQISLQHAATQGVGPRFQNRPQARAWVACAQRFQRSGNRGGMMRKVVDDGDAVHLRLDFEATLHALESLQRGGDGFFGNAAGSGQRRGGGRVPDVVFAGQRKFEVGPGLTVVQDGPGGAGGFEAQVGDPPVRARAGAIALDRAEGFGQTALQAGAFGASPANPSKATMRPRRGIRFTRRLNAVSTASRSL